MMNKRRSRPGPAAGVAAGLALVLAALPAAAQEARKPDWSGLYAIVPPNGEQLPGYQSQHPILDTVIMRHMQPWAIAKMLGTNTRADDTGAVCKKAGMFRHPTTVYGFRWLQKPGQMVVISEAFSQVGTRRIHMTDAFPKTLPLTWNGYSIGRWEGEVLVVETRGYHDRSWLMSAMQPHTSELVVVERIREVADGTALEVVTTVDDRQALTGPYSFSRYYRRLDRDFVEDVCNGEPGEPLRWNTFRKRAIEAQDAHRRTLAPDPDAPPPAPPALG